MGKNPKGEKTMVISPGLLGETRGLKSPFQGNFYLGRGKFHHHIIKEESFDES